MSVDLASDRRRLRRYVVRTATTIPVAASEAISVAANCTPENSPEVTVWTAPAMEPAVAAVSETIAVAALATVPRDERR